MAKRLQELYGVGDVVEIYFGMADEWRLGRVLAHDPPGMWVGTVGGGEWFVTNGRRVRVVGDGEVLTEAERDAE
ncbi:MAG TPA: hypothetical protein VLL52_04335 [Anaerolineae bacterium]|nr:hypothetical protein [Anaerolineae bacterium]